MKLIYVFLGVFSLKIVCMDKPPSPKPPKIKPAAAHSKVKAAAAAWPPKPAAAFLAKKSAASLKRSSDEEEPFQRRPRKSIDTLDVVMTDALKLVAKPSAQSLIDKVKTEVQKGQLKIISTNPPVCEVVLDSVKWKCRRCGREFKNKEEEIRHVKLSHGVIPADPEQEWGIDWEYVNSFQNYMRITVRPFEDQQLEDQQEEEVEEIVA